MLESPTAPPSSPERSGESPAGRDVAQALRESAKAVRSKQDFYRQSLRILANHFDAPNAAIAVDSATGSQEDTVARDESGHAQWKSISAALMLDSRYRNLPMAKLYDAGDGNTYAAMAAPICEESSGPVGALFLVQAKGNKTTAAASLTELRTLVSLIGVLATTIPARHSIGESNTLTQEHQGAVKAAPHKSLHDFAFALANGIKTKIGCEQVSLGLVKGRRIQLLCVSGFDDLYPRSPGARLITQAMEECLDAGCPVGYQNESGTTAGDGCSTGHLLHRRWHEQTGSPAVVSLPLDVEGNCAAILSLVATPSNPFDQQRIEQIRKVVSPLVGGLLLQDRAARGVIRHAWDSGRKTCGRWLGHGAWGRKAILLGLMVFAAWLVLGKTKFVVTIPCQVIASRTRQIAAPYEGTLLKAHVHPGDTVKAGDLLLEFDDRDLVLERKRLASKHKIAQLELTQALLEHDHSAAAQAAARIEMVSADLELVQHRIRQSKIVAKSDGSVLSGDVSARVGEVIPLGEPLLVLAPDGDWSVELQIPQHAASYLHIGQTGSFTTIARPDQEQACEITRAPVSTRVAEGRTMFTGEAKSSGNQSWIRPGMTGIAKIDAGRRAVWWVNLHRIVDTLRMNARGAF